MNKQYNIMTSCNDNLVTNVTIALTSMAHSLKDAHVDFYLLHNNINNNNIKMLDALCNNLGTDTQIVFHDIKVPDSDIETYTELAKYGNGCPIESYYPLSAHLYLPISVDRVMYLDVGDAIVTGDIEPYYRYGFNGKSLIVTGARYVSINNGSSARVYNENDLSDGKEGLPSILNGLFNPGSYVINLEKIRSDERTLEDYKFLAETLRNVIGNDKPNIYNGVQGLLSATFVGDIQYYFFTELQNVFYMPYNFCLWYYNNFSEKPPYTASITNFSGVPFKPCQGKYPIHIKRFQLEENKLHSLDELRNNQAGYFYQWHEYAIIADSILEKIGY